MSHRVALIFGVGANIGQNTAKAFTAKGYKVALASRSLKSEDSTADELHIPTDCSDTDAIVQAFVKVKSVYGPPSVVVYNAHANKANSPTDVFEIPLDLFKKNTSINIFGSYAAAQEAVKAWKELPESANPTYIFTGNCTNTAPVTGLMDLGVGKSGAASFIEVAADAYKDKTYKFYYADERHEDGSPMYTGLNGEGHAKLYTDLAEGSQQLPWQQTFVTGVGYKKF